MSKNISKEINRLRKEVNLFDEDQGLNLKKLDNIKMIPNNDIISNLVYKTIGKNVDTTIVDGNILMENRKMKFIDSEKIISKFV